VSDDQTTQSILAGLGPERIVAEGFPHIFVPNALEASFYAELAAAFPSMERIAGPGPLPSNQVFRTPACDVLADPAIPRIWRDFFAYHCSGRFLAEMVGFWRDAIAREYPEIEGWFGKPLSSLTSGVRHYRKDKPAENLPENLQTDARLDCQFFVNSPVTTPSSVRGSHVDKPYKLFAALLYFRHPEDRSEGGNLLLERFKTRRHPFDRRQHVPDRFVEPFAEVPYAPNTLIMWLNTSRSLHSVTPRSVTPVPRRGVNFLTECYKLPAEGFFPLERTLPGRVHSTLKRVIRTRLMRAAPAPQS
jgi:hypothetical protein